MKALHSTWMASYCQAIVKISPFCHTIIFHNKCVFPTVGSAVTSAILNGKLHWKKADLPALPTFEITWFTNLQPIFKFFVAHRWTWCCKGSGCHGAGGNLCEGGDRFRCRWQQTGNKYPQVQCWGKQTSYHFTSSYGIRLILNSNGRSWQYSCS